MAVEPERGEVLAWLNARRTRRPDDAIAHFWGSHVAEPELTRLRNLIRQWKHRAAKPTPVELAQPVETRAASDERGPSPARRSRPVPPHPTSTDPPLTFLTRQLDQLLIDVEEARAYGQLQLVPALNAQITSVHSRLAKLPPGRLEGEPGQAGGPLFSDSQLAGMTPEQLGAAILALSGASDSGPAS